MPGSGGRVGKFRAALDSTASLAIILVCGALLWILIRDIRHPAPASQQVLAGPSRGRPAPPPLPSEPLSLAGATIRGNRAAKVAVIEFSDFQCPFCGQFARDTLPDLEKKYVDSGKLLLAFRHFPLSQIHQFATRASEAAECAGQQDKFWSMHDSLFAKQKNLDDASLRDRARELGLDSARFSACLAGQSSEKVRQDLAAGQIANVTGTPTFFLGRVGADGRVVVSERLAGALPLAAFGSSLDKLLNDVPSSK